VYFKAGGFQDFIRSAICSGLSATSIELVSVLMVMMSPSHTAAIGPADCSLRSHVAHHESARGSAEAPVRHQGDFFKAPRP
jgi:hypothetical protein